MNSVINLSQLPAPDVVETLSYEAILAAMLEDLRSRSVEFTALVESDPAYKILEVAAYRELLLRQRVNDAARSVMVAHATGANLDNLAALFGVTRHVIEPGDPDAVPPVSPIYESDERLRTRIPLALEGYSTAGPIGAYTFHALAASGDVKDVGVTSPTPGDVVVTVLSIHGDGMPTPELIALVDTQLNDEGIRPLTDRVTVQGAEIVSYQIDATLTIRRGPDQSVVVAAAEESVAEYVNDHHRLGADVTLSGLYAALHRPGVQNVVISSPSSDILIDGQHAAYATEIDITPAS